MKYCSDCGNKLDWMIPENDNRPRHVCQACGMIHYENPKIVVGCIPEWKDKILLCRRGIEPQMGLWTLPAGYLENGETVEAGAVRETLEETGAVVTDLTPYRLIDIIHINQIYFIFRSRMKKPFFQRTRESTEVKLFSESEIPWEQIAFQVIKQTLQAYYQDRLTHEFIFKTQPLKKD